MIPLTHILLDL